ncbi:MAG: DUF308 domain-containing protein [Lachnospiraceae bacterium]|nr:DUF308 domain-containing protein [Lachnospiraceae bacterium]
MSLWQRFENVIRGITAIVCSGLLMRYPREGYKYVAMIISLTLMVKGLMSLVKYFTLTRYMVGGRASLYWGVLILDFGAFTYTISDESRFHVVIYLMIIHAFTGMIDLMRALESRSLGSPSWRMKACQGAVNIMMVLFSVIFVRSVRMLVYLYSLGLIYSGVMRILSTFRKTDMVYIQ